MSSKHKPWQNTRRDTDETQGITRKNTYVSRHLLLDRPAPQTQNATKLKQTHPRHTDTQAKHSKTQSKHSQTQSKHWQTQIGPEKKSAKGGGAKLSQNSVKTQRNTKSQTQPNTNTVFHATKAQEAGLLLQQARTVSARGQGLH